MKPRSMQIRNIVCRIVMFLKYVFVSVLLCSRFHQHSTPATDLEYGRSGSDELFWHVGPNTLID